MASTHLPSWGDPTNPTARATAPTKGSSKPTASAGTPHQAEALGRAGTGLSQRASKSQQATLPPVLTAELGPASPNRRRSCNHTHYGRVDTSRMKPPSAAHTGDSCGTFWSRFCSQSLPEVRTNSWFGQRNTGQKTREETMRTADPKPATQVPSLLLTASFFLIILTQGNHKTC